MGMTFRFLVPSGKTPASRHPLFFCNTNFKDYSQLVTAKRDGYILRWRCLMDLHFFDRNAEYTVIERRLPHWVQPGVVCFVTWRTDDSFPASVLEKWRQDRRQWLRQRGINPISRNWRQHLQLLDIEAQAEFYQHFSKRWHDELDACHGACVLRDHSNAEIVRRSLRYFDGDRYELTDFIVMPNHVHLLETSVSVWRQ